jgi:hypothetical protein
VLWWIEGDTPGAPHPFTARYALVQQGGMWQPEAPLSVLGGVGGAIQRVTWASSWRWRG